MASVFWVPPAEGVVVLWTFCYYSHYIIFPSLSWCTVQYLCHFYANNRCVLSLIPTVLISVQCCAAAVVLVWASVIVREGGALRTRSKTLVPGLAWCHSRALQFDKDPGRGWIWLHSSPQITSGKVQILNTNCVVICTHIYRLFLYSFSNPSIIHVFTDCFGGIPWCEWDSV